MSIVIFLAEGGCIIGEMTMEVAEAAWIALDEVAGVPVSEISLIADGIAAEDVMDPIEWEAYKELRSRECPFCGKTEWCDCDPA